MKEMSRKNMENAYNDLLNDYKYSHSKEKLNIVLFYEKTYI